MVRYWPLGGACNGRDVRAGVYAFLSPKTSCVRPQPHFFASTVHGTKTTKIFFLAEQLHLQAMTKQGQKDLSYQEKLVCLLRIGRGPRSQISKDLSSSLEETCGICLIRKPRAVAHDN
jgi:hypothetical protein